MPELWDIYDKNRRKTGRIAERDEKEAVKKYFNPQNIDSVYILYDLYSIKERDAVHTEVKEILEKKAEEKK